MEREVEYPGQIKVTVIREVARHGLRALTLDVADFPG